MTTWHGLHLKTAKYTERPPNALILYIWQQLYYICSTTNKLPYIYKNLKLKSPSKKKWFETQTQTQIVYFLFLLFKKEK
jgi:hypothetical protein